MPEKKRILIGEGLFHIPESPDDQPYLIGSKCSNCGYIAFPKVMVCPRCMKEETMKETPLSRRGKLDTFAIVAQAPSGFKTPHMMAKINLPEGVKVFSLLTGVEPSDDALTIGQEVEMVIDIVKQNAQGEDVIGWKFRPVQG
ncbi:MAG: OB-fold domain-containing protein [Dehalococcoidales bacterium]|nr:OB-fold domain-containing protein [Dehalococcoidales bacterium]